MFFLRLTCKLAGMPVCSGTWCMPSMTSWRHFPDTLSQVHMSGKVHIGTPRRFCSSDRGTWHAIYTCMCHDAPSDNSLVQSLLQKFSKSSSPKSVTWGTDCKYCTWWVEELIQARHCHAVQACVYSSAISHPVPQIQAARSLGDFYK